MNRKECTTPISMISLLLLLLETDNDDTLYFDWLINLLTEQIAIFPMIIHFSNASDEKWNIYREIYDDVWEMYERFFFVVEFVLFVCVRLSSHTQCHAFSLFTSPFFVSLELVVFPLFWTKFWMCHLILLRLYILYIFLFIQYMRSCIRYYCLIGQNFGGQNVFGEQNFRHHTNSIFWQFCP